jgi:hypothetical protein
MKWRRRGQLFTAEGQREWMVSHAANPVAEPRGGDVYRIYFGCRDRANRSHVGHIDVEWGDAPRLLDVAAEPDVAPGARGRFDDSGASMGCLVNDRDSAYLFYVGWNLGVTVPWRNSIGLAVRTGPARGFIKHSPAPLLDRCAADPYTLSYPCILRDEGRWRMWYGSNLSWGEGHETDMHHVIKYAESDDALHWRREGVVAINLELPGEYALCRPWVTHEAGLYRMWFCHRGPAYRVGYAESNDALTWRRRPGPLELDPAGGDAWDSEMVAYPFVFAHRGRHFLLYNGNRYGRTGFGFAELNN